MELHHDALHGGRAHWFRLRGRQMDEHRRTINYLHTGHTRYFMCGPQLTHITHTHQDNKTCFVGREFCFA